MFSFIYRWFPSRLLDRPFSFESNGEKMTHIEVGEVGERMATAYLRRMGCKVLYRNYRGPKGGELDIVVRDGQLLCFVEVKTRRSREGSRPLDAVNRKKQALIERGARSWLALLSHNEFQWRFDVIEVVLEEGAKPLVNRVEDAF